MNKSVKQALMYGAGSIGRGFLGQLFEMSGYATCFIDVDEKLVSQLNSDEQYVITVATESGYESQTIHHARAVNGMNSTVVANEVACCDIMATAVGVNILPRIAKTIATGIDQRFTSGNNSPLDIIVCENISDSGNYLKNLISPYIENIEYFKSSIGFVSASVGRMVPVNADVNSSKIIVESYNELPVDAKAMKTDLSEIFNVIPVAPFAIEKHKKYFMHNMSHAIVAYLGFVRGYKYLWEAMDDDFIKVTAEKALDESIRAISGYYSVAEPPLKNYGADLLKRYSNKYLKDTVIRVGRDPKRKLQPQDRLTGAVNFCLNQGFTPENILFGIAGAFYFNVLDDVSSHEIITYVKEYGIESAITEYTGVTDQSPVFSKILKIYSQLKND